jgi:hypothetical protein
MTPEALALAQVLLVHRKQHCRSQDSTAGITETCLITYSDLCERVELPHLTPAAGKFLREIAQRCHENGWPPLNSLVVNHETRKPGHGYDSAPGCSLKNWRDEVAACLNFSGYPDTFC